MNRRGFIKALFGAAAAVAILPRFEGLAPLDTPRWLKDAAVESLTTGDLFTIEGVYAVNPLTYQPTTMLQQFVITADVTSDSDAEIWPTMRVDGPYQNVTAFPADDAQLIPIRVGVCHGSPLAAGSGQTGRTITTHGWTVDAEVSR